MIDINEKKDDGVPECMDPRVFDEMLPYLTKRFGNAASLNHRFGQDAQDACEYARQKIAAVIHARAAREIIFTSGGMESNTLAIKGVAHSYLASGHHIITSTTAPESIIHACQSLASQGYRVTYLNDASKEGIDPQQVSAAITDETILISLGMAYDNRIYPIAEIGKIARDAEVLFHVDALDTLRRIPIDVEVMGIDLLSLTGESLGGPRDAGCLYVRSRKPRVRLTPLIDGGGQERDWRSGTLNVPGIVGLAAACILSHENIC